MKKTAVLLAIVMVATALAQSAGQFALSAPTGALSTCPTPVAGANILCSVTDGYYASISGAAYAKINVGTQQAGVSSFNGRSGNVMPAANDYKYSDLANQPTSLTCTTGTAGNTGIAGSGCTFK